MILSPSHELGAKKRVQEILSLTPREKKEDYKSYLTVRILLPTAEAVKYILGRQENFMKDDR